MDKIVDFQNAKSVKAGFTPLSNTLDDIAKQADELDVVVVMARDSKGDFRMWLTGDGDPAEAILTIEACKMRFIGGMFPME